MLHPTRCRLAPRVLIVLVLLALANAWPARAADVVLYRLFLRDGATVVSYGDFARVAGTVVFSFPVAGIGSSAPTLRLVSLPESLVDWTRTDAYREAARAKQFAETRGEAEFSQLSTQVASTLNELAFTENPAQRLALAERARKMLAEWPAANFGYRAPDVAQLSGMFDEVISELRVAAGQSRFDVTLLANPGPPPSVPMLPAPTERDSIEQAFALSRASQDAAQRTSLLHDIMNALGTSPEPGGWAAALRARAGADLVTAIRTDKAYASLSARTLRTADLKLRKADVAGIERLVREVLDADDGLGRLRPNETAALLATLDARKASAQRLRLQADQWALRQGAVRAYMRKAQPALDCLSRAHTAFEAMRGLAGPSPKVLRQLGITIGVQARELSLVKPAADLEGVHATLTMAYQMAMRATDARTRAASGNDMDLAWQASSAAAGALLMLDRARDELRQLRMSPLQ